MIPALAAAEVEDIIARLAPIIMPLGLELIQAIENLIRSRHAELLAAPPESQEAAIEAEDAAAIVSRFPPTLRATLATEPDDDRAVVKR